MDSTASLPSTKTPSGGHLSSTLLASNHLLAPEDLPLQRIYRFEQEHAQQALFTQPWQGQTTTWTWAEAMSEVRRIASYLIAQNYPPGSRIAIMAKNSAWWIMADFAIWIAGHVSVPVFSSIQETSLIAIFEQCRPVACFLGQVEHLPALHAPIFQQMHWVTLPHAALPNAVAWESILAAQPPLASSPTRAAEDLASIIYTSGTTGQPKGVMHAFRSFSLMAISVARALANNGQPERMISYLPLAHIAERAIVEMGTFFNPLHVFFTEGQAAFLTDLQRAQPTIFFTIPRLLIRFQQGVFEKMPAKKLDFFLRVPILSSIASKKVLSGLGLATVRIAASGAAPLPVSILEWYHRVGLNLVEGYGMTETGITHAPDPGKDRAGYVGSASSYAETRIAEDGEIQIKGPMNFLGYYGNPEATAACFTADGFFRTGDRGQIDEEGRLRIIGRLKEEFKTSKGKYVVPARIEKALSLCTLLESVCVLGSGMTAPFALVVLNPEMRTLSTSAEGRAAIERELLERREIVNAQLEHHEWLQFVAVDSEPWTVDNSFLTPTLKVRRNVIESRLGSRFEQWEQQKKQIVWLEPIH